LSLSARKKEKKKKPWKCLTAVLNKKDLRKEEEGF